MTIIVAYCETPLQIRIANAIADKGGSHDRFQIITGNWSDDVGQHDAAKASVIAHVMLEAENGLALKARWRAIRDRTADYLSDAPRRLLMFQDQHFFAQAIAAGARKARAPYDLVQDGYLDFDMRPIPAAARMLWPLMRMIDSQGPRRPSTRMRPLYYRALYWSHFFGHTRPDHIFVYGRSIGARLKHQFGIPEERVTVAGPPLAVSPPPAAPRPLKQPGAMRVLFFDQCALRYRRMPEAVWRGQYLDNIRALREFNADVKLHPAQTEDCVRDIESAMQGRGAILGREPAGNNHLDDIDIAVTMTSSAFIQCLELGVPVIFTDIKGSLDRMPRIQSPLIRNVASPDELRQSLIGRRDGGFTGNETGFSLSDFIDYQAGGAALIARRLLT